jgi:thiosulfate reductase cytochrome b subunit
MAPDPIAPGTLIRRHGVVTRLWHWVNAVAVVVLIGSGLGISNAHPRLYWGRLGANFDAAWAVLPRFPAWITIPANYNLAMSRRWHLFFALVLAFALLGYMIASLLNRHILHDLSLHRAELGRRHLWADLRAHLDFRFHDPEAPRAYNVFQKLSYILVIFVALPLVIFTGIALSPGMNAAWPWLLDLFGGRQSARSLHFIAMVVLAGFTVVHLVLVILAGAWNGTRSMLTGRWRIPG